MSVYMRRVFRVNDPSIVSTLTLTVDDDDGFVAYLNGTEVARRNVVGTPPLYNQVATADHECSVCGGTCNAAESISLTSYKNLLVAGTNVLAIQAHNLTLASSDFTITPTMTATYAGCTSNAQCDDGQWCNGAETCDLGVHTCQSGTAPNCADAFACTTDSCNETTDGCVHTPSNATCSDGLACNGTETCDPVAGCQSGTAPNCDDGIACTADACVEPTGCRNVDGCTGGQVCNPTSGLCETPSYPPLPIEIGDTWSYLKGTAEPSTPVQLPPVWAGLGFDDAAWLTGPSGFGFGAAGADCETQRTGGTNLGDMQNPPSTPGYMSLYLRKSSMSRTRRRSTVSSSPCLRRRVRRLPERAGSRAEQPDRRAPAV